MDLWAQLYLLDQGERLEKSITFYKEKYFISNRGADNIVYSYKPKPMAIEVIKNKISDICISLSAKDYLKMPEIIYDTKYVKLDDKARFNYDIFEKNMFLEIDEEELSVTSAAALTNKLLQFANGAVYKEDGKEFIEVHKNKIEALKEQIEALQGQAALIFYNFKHDLNRIEKLLKQMKVNYGVLKSSEDIARWNNKKLNILLAHPASAAYGLNLQDGGHHVIWFGLNWSLELYKQANARLYRQGQKETVIIHHLVSVGTMDENVLEALKEKDTNQNKLLELLKARIKKIKEENR